MKIKVWFVIVSFLSLCSITGCSKQELEKSAYPMAILIDRADEEQLSVTFTFPRLKEKTDQNIDMEKTENVAINAPDFYSAIQIWNQNENNILDCNHVKAIVLGSTFLQDTKAVKKFLNYIQKEDALARNVLLFECQDCTGLAQEAQALSTSLGEYLDGLLENQREVKDRAAVTLGTLLNQMYNQDETIFVPKLKAENKKVNITSYRAIRCFQAQGEVTTEQQQIATLLNNQRTTFSYSLVDGTLLRLEHIRLRYQMSKTEHPTQDVILSADVSCLSGSFLNGKKRAKKLAEAESTLRTMLIRTTKELAEEKLEVTNSYVRLAGRNRNLYEKYVDAQLDYETTLTTSYSVHLKMVR